MKDKDNSCDRKTALSLLRWVLGYSKTTLARAVCPRAISYLG